MALASIFLCDRFSNYLNCIVEELVACYGSNGSATMPDHDVAARSLKHFRSMANCLGKMS